MFATDAKTKKAIRELRGLAIKYPSESFLASVSNDLDALCTESSPEVYQQATLHMIEVLPSGNYGSGKNLGSDVAKFKENIKKLKEVLKDYEYKGSARDDDRVVTARIVQFLTALSTIDHAFKKEVDHLKRERNGIDFDDMLWQSTPCS